MKTYLLILVGCFHATCIFPQNPSVMLKFSNVPVPIYVNPVDEVPKTMIMQDTINDFYYAVNIIDKSPLRFKVNITLVIGREHEQEIIGWVDKFQCAVFQRWYYNKDNQTYVKLYSEPDAFSTYIELYENTRSASSYAMTLIDYAHGGWLKVIFMHNNTMYEGWVDRYCSDVYDSCT